MSLTIASLAAALDTRNRAEMLRRIADVELTAGVLNYTDAKRLRQIADDLDAARVDRLPAPTEEEISAMQLGNIEGIKAYRDRTQVDLHSARDVMTAVRAKLGPIGNR